LNKNISADWFKMLMACHYLPSGYADALKSTSPKLKRIILLVLVSGFDCADRDNIGHPPLLAVSD